jgi:hypothetical protein
MLNDTDVTQYHYAKWEERSLGTATLVQRAHRRIASSLRRGPLDVWINVADAGYPTLPLPQNPSPSSVTLETVASTREDANLLFPDYSVARWSALGYDGGQPLAEFVASLIRAGARPAPRKLRRTAFWAGNAEMHPVRGRLLELARERPRDLEIRHVAPDSMAGARPDGWVSFARLAEWEVLLDVPGGGWSGRLKFLPLLRRPLIVLHRDAWGWADGSVLRPYEHYRPVKGRISGEHAAARYALDEADLWEQLRWCREHKAEAAAMAQRAMRASLAALTDEAVDAQAVRALRRRAVDRGLWWLDDATDE